MRSGEHPSLSSTRVAFGWRPTARPTSLENLDCSNSCRERVSSVDRPRSGWTCLDDVSLATQRDGCSETADSGTNDDEAQRRMHG